MRYETSVPGVFAAGDVRFGSIKRVASAVGEGSVAVQEIEQYLAPAPHEAPVRASERAEQSDARL